MHLNVCIRKHFLELFKFRYWFVCIHRTTSTNRGLLPNTSHLLFVSAYFHVLFDIAVYFKHSMHLSAFVCFNVSSCREGVGGGTLAYGPRPNPRAPSEQLYRGNLRWSQPQVVPLYFLVASTRQCSRRHLVPLQPRILSSSVPRWPKLFAFIVCVPIPRDS